MNNDSAKTLKKTKLRSRAQTKQLQPETLAADMLLSGSNEQIPLDGLQAGRHEQARRNSAEFEQVNGGTEFPRLRLRVSDLYALAPIGYFTIAQNGTVLTANPAAADLLCIEHAHLAGKRFQAFLSDESSSDFAVFLEKVIKGAARDAIEVSLRSGDGYPLFVRIVASVSEQGPECLLAVVDITQRKRMVEMLQSEQTILKSIISNIPHFVYWKDINSVYLGCNENFARVAGVENPESIVGRTDHDLAWKSEEATLYLEDDRRVMESGLQKLDSEISQRQADGKEATILESKVPLRDGTGNISGVIGIYSDITEFIRSEEEKRIYQAKLIQADKMASLGLLVSGMAHEINNPNNYIMFNSQLLSKAWQSVMPILDEYYRENGDFKLGDFQFSETREIVPRLFTGLLDGSERIRNIVDKLKDFARQNSGCTCERVDVNKVILDAIAILNHEIKKHCDSFSLAAGCDIPAAQGDAQQIEQVVINLIMNSLQALPDKKRGIRITTALVEGGKRIAITVVDEGCGMSPEVLKRLGEPFFTTRSNSGGTGLGLSISSSILRENQGELKFVSEPGKGTTATVLLQIFPDKTVKS